MNQTVQRLLIFFLGIPLVIVLVLANFYNRLPLNCVVCVFSFLAANELYKIFSEQDSCSVQNGFLVSILSVILPISQTIFVTMQKNSFVLEISFVFAVLFSISWEFLTAKSFEHSNKKMSSSVLIIFYSGFLLSFIIKMNALKNATHFIILFFLNVFLCDSLAWLFGMLFGKNNRGIFRVSPNKSIAGFLGGFLAGVGISVLAYFFVPEIFESLWKMIFLGFWTTLFAIFGDLAESVIKRSAKKKDSGALILGRGGVLDSIDSVAFAAPIFYLIVKFLF